MQKKKVLMMWGPIEELKGKKNVVVLFKDNKRVSQEIKYHNREIEKGRDDNPLFIVFLGDLGEGPIYFVPAPLDVLKDAKVPILTPAYLSDIVDNCEALAYWLLRYPICGRAITERAKRLIGKCAQILEKAKSDYQIDCAPPPPPEIRNLI